MLCLRSREDRYCRTMIADAQDRNLRLKAENSKEDLMKRWTVIRLVSDKPVDPVFTTKVVVECALQSIARLAIASPVKLVIELI